jgi:hypothetical protein
MDMQYPSIEVQRNKLEILHKISELVGADLSLKAIEILVDLIQLGVDPSSLVEGRNIVDLGFVIS